MILLYEKTEILEKLSLNEQAALRDFLRPTLDKLIESFLTNQLKETSV